MMYGSIEAGGTKFVCAVGNKDLEIIHRIEFETTIPSETMKEVIDFFTKHKVSAIGVGSFGPIDINPKSKTYGFITNTPKIPWQDFDFLGSLSVLDVPLAWTTDVNASAYGEYISDGTIDSCTYFTFGTGVGAGLINNGAIYSGVNHLEMGHMVIKRNILDKYPGYCIYHGDCLEGLASGPSIEARIGTKAQNIDADHEVFDFVAQYIAQAALNTTLSHSPERIILGGGVMQKEGLIDKVRNEFKVILNDYVDIKDIDSYLMLPKLGNNAGTVGCLALARSL